ncbi:hypothetical protein DMH12_24835 [Streptomyces sp. WAC 04229]|uniref:hypothetical protein n=1 Tax=Streptomyces sp. WAC 04229 TaxID=2203206 RepID=UPI000F73B94A|nr:hypothetical protein [Streptomyces sp. WAC 04229]RSN50511.1 hypothetical protein DMH12_24835 [Streptomyces sp. WAC 04229]
MSIDMEQLGVPPFDSAAGGRWMQQQAVFKALTSSGESSQVVAALTALVAAFDNVVALHEGQPEGTSARNNVLGYLDRLTGVHVYEGLAGLPRISNAPACAAKACGHSRQAHVVDPDLCRDCVGLDAAHHGYTPGTC